MRKKFAELVYSQMQANPNIVIISGDLGYGIWDAVRADFPDRFINSGAAEQLMMAMAVGMAMEGKVPIVYSITPFLLYRPFEIIRNYINHEKIKVILIGSGRDKDYAHDGFSHWAEEDKQVMKPFYNIGCRHPKDEEMMQWDFEDALRNQRATYINLKR